MILLNIIQIFWITSGVTLVMTIQKELSLRLTFDCHCELSFIVIASFIFLSLRAIARQSTQNILPHFTTDNLSYRLPII